MDWSADLAFAHRLADAADDLTRPHVGRAMPSVVKPDGSPLTAIDAAVEERLQELVAAERPADGFLGEEVGAARAGARRWIVDGIDGTSSFSLGRSEWATLIALEAGGDLVIGIASAPALHSRWWAARGQGAWRSDLPMTPGGSVALRVNVDHDDRPRVEGWVSPWSASDEAKAMFEHLHRHYPTGGDLPWATPRPRGQRPSWDSGHPGGALLVAGGPLDAYVMAGGGPWDYAATAVIVEEAGGRFTDLGGRRDISGGSAVFSNGRVHDDILAALRRVHVALIRVIRALANRRLPGGANDRGVGARSAQRRRGRVQHGGGRVRRGSIPRVGAVGPIGPIGPVGAVAVVPVVFVVAIALSVTLLLVTARLVRAASPIDGVYRVAEGAVSGQGGAAGACWDTPMRTKLDPTTPPGEASIYDVQITANGDQVTFSQPGAGGVLLTEPLALSPNPSPGGPSNYVTQQTRNAPATTSSAADFWILDGRFLVLGPGNVDVTIVWTYADSPNHTGQCQTQISGSLSSPATAVTPGGAGGIPIAVVIGVVGGVAVVTAITIGGWRWRNRTGKPLTPPGDRLAPNVPARCRDIATRHDTELEVLNGLRSAETELTEKLDRAETIHKNNIIKARMVFNLEIIQTVGGFTTDLALALRPSVLRTAVPVIGEQDTWRPPGSITEAMSERIRQAQEAATNLWGRFQQLKNQVEMLRGTVQEAVEALPLVKEAKQVWQINMNRLGEMMADLPTAEALRGQIAKLEPDIAAARGNMDATETAWRAAQREVSDAESAVNAAKNKLSDSYRLASTDLSKAEKRVKDMAGYSADNTLRLTAESELAEAKIAMSQAERDSTADLQRIADLQAAVESKKAPVDAAWEKHVQAGTAYDELAGQRQTLSNTLTMQYNDLTAADIKKQADITAQAERKIAQAESQGTAQVGRDLMERQAEQERTFEEAQGAQQLVKDLQVQAERDNSWNRRVSRTLGSGVKTVLTPITYPVGLLVEGWEWAFGRSQTPQEIVDILVRGQTNIRILRSYLNELDTKLFNQEQLVERLRTQVEACVNGVSVTDGSAPATPPAQPPVATPGGAS